MNMKKIIALLLAVLMVLPLFVACGEKPADDTQTGDTDSTVKESDDAKTTAYVREKYGSYDYDGYTFTILGITPGTHYYWMIDGMDGTGWCNEVWYEEDNADAQIHSVFTRNTLTEELLNITISQMEGGGTYEIDDKVKMLIKAGGNDFDVTLGDLTCNIPLGMEGYFYNLYDLPTFDVTNEWWDKEFVDTFTLKKSYLFNITGDYTIFDDYAAACIFYNKQIVENYGLTDPADLVDAGTWTIDTMMEMAQTATKDLSGNGMDADDEYGFYDNGYALTHITEGCNIHITELNEEGIPEVVVENESFTNAVQKVFESVIMSPATFLDEGTHDKSMMLEDRVLFLYEQLGGINQLRDMGSDFSLVPLPKLNEQQERYTSVVNGIWCTALSVSINIQDTDRTGIILDVLGGMSTDTVNKALHEVVLGPKLFREQRTRDMLDYVVDSTIYDWAKDIPWAYGIYNILADQTTAKAFTLASSLQSQLKSIKAQLKRFYMLVGKEQ